MTPATRIAIIDDDVSLTEILTEFLTDEGYLVASWHSRDTALTDIPEFAPDVVILDIRIGGKEVGLDILEDLRHIHQTAQTPVIVSTANDWVLRESSARLRDLHASTLAKPFDLDELLGHIEASIRTPF